MHEMDNSAIIHPTSIDSQGRVMIPAVLRSAMKIHAGHELVWIVRDSGIWLEKLNQDG